MTTFDELILSAEVQLDQATKRREAALATVKLIHKRAQNDGRAELTELENGEIRAAMGQHDDADREVKAARENVAQLKTAKAHEDANTLALEARAEGRSSVAVAERPAYDRVARVTREERTYHEGNDKARTGGGFVRDILLQHLYRDLEAEQRLSRHMSEERVERGQYLTRAVGTGAFAGLTVPQYLTDMYAPKAAAQRPFADICTKHPLPADGMTVNISTITTATAVALQATENVAVQETNIDDTLLTENIQTAAGQQTISRQAIDRGTGVESVVLDDLFRRYATTLDNTLILQASTGLKAVATTQTYTDASPTTAKIYSQIIGGASTVETTLLGFAQPDFALMHPRRWYSMLGAVASTWPSIYNPASPAPVQATGNNNGLPYASGIRGVLQSGMSVIADANLETNLGGGTNQDQIYVGASQECHLWEDPNAPVLIRAEQPSAANLGVLLVVYGYFAYTFRRFGSGTGSFVKIDGTGLVTPTFLGA